MARKPNGKKASPGAATPTPAAATLMAGASPGVAVLQHPAMIPVGTGMMAPAVPPTLSAAHMTIGMSPAEILLTFGQSRLMFAPGQTGGVAGVEWFSTVAMSPTFATQMHRRLGQVLGEYRKLFGAIPEGPEEAPFKVQAKAQAKAKR
jgi:hypothetical protein